VSSWLGILEKPIGSKASELKLVQTIVILMKNTTWRCGKIERDIVRHLYKRHESFRSPKVSIKELMANLNITSEKREEYLNALKRLEKRNIVKIMQMETGAACA
jgi:hypothetical protein